RISCCSPATAIAWFPHAPHARRRRSTWRRSGKPSPWAGERPGRFLENRAMLSSNRFRWAIAAVMLGVPAVPTLVPAQQPGKGQKLPETVKLEADIPSAATNNPRQQLNLLLPKAAKDDKPLPVIVYIHGGAWLGGNRTGGHGRLAA